MVLTSPQPQLLDQAILQGEVCPFHAALGLAAVGTEAVDVQLIQGAAKLGVTGTALGLLVVAAKHAGLVAVEGPGFAVTL
jgi:hypothetical protein